MPEHSGTILVTGASGFVGQYLCAELGRTFHGSRVAGTGTTGKSPGWAVDSGIDWAQLDMRDAVQVHELVARFKPTLVYHLAALSHVPTAFRQPHQTWATNTMGTLHLLEAMRAEAPSAALVYVSSGNIYGRSFQPSITLDEGALLQPADPYSASKAAADLMVQEAGARDVDAVCLRPFNHIGPGQRADFVVASFARQVARIERDLQEPVITVGNLDAQRDFTDVRDIVRAYARIGASISKIDSGSVLNVCSGQPRQIRSVLDDLLGLAEARIEVAVDPSNLRPSDTPYAAGSAVRLERAVDWHPSIAWQQTLQDVLDDWRISVAREPAG